ncbi:YhcH/YjgK/YiaL family protein [uncultured Mucilaginibacter sp.]|uniref:YhcH/YjgK/YiaL family protein n=1 Tax=uncultured Mucilaginibacter sp. TaxID=797541 RepID=UPI0025E1D2DB|nr:YhcH/YjgK/YiaL family protein [uncultured Mucilaginibacter sp.]
MDNIENITASKEAAENWFTSGAYLNGLEIKPHKTTDMLEFARQYAANKQQWDTAFEYLKNTDLKALNEGKHSLEGSDLYIAVSESTNKDLADAKWESHKKAIDIQYVIDGAEQMGVTQASQLNVTDPYDELKDVMFYKGEGELHLATPAEFFVFFPSDVHRPMVKADGYWGSKKIVLKLKYME